jgi:autotransporter family porin
VEFEDSDSFRGRLGARIGGVFQTANYAISPDLTVSVWQEFSGENQATIGGFAPVADFTAEDDRDETFGEVSVGLSATGQNGWSGFLKGDYTFADDYNAAAVNGGVRYNW